MGILFILVAVIGIVSWGIVKSDELSGLGRRVKAGSLRHPHGRLEQVYCEHPPVRRPFAARLRSVLPVVTVPLVVVISLGALALEHAGVLFGVVAVDFLSSGAGVLLVAGECLLRLAKPAQSFANYIVLLVAGNEGLFNLGIQGYGALCLESPCPKEELIEVTLDNDELKVDGNMALAWSGSLNFTVERSGKSLIGSAASGEGLVNVYRGTGKVLLAPTTY